MNPSFFQYAAKAVAAAVTPPALVALAWLSSNIFPFDYDPQVIESAIVGLVTGGVVYVRKNQHRIEDVLDELG